MDEKDQHGQQSEHSRELRRKRNKRKCFLYILLFLVFQTAVILLFVLIVMKIRTPKFRVTSAVFDTFDYSSAASNPSFTIRMNAELSVKNSNFGRYKYGGSTVSFYHGEVVVGSVLVPGSRVGMRSTKKFDVVVDLSSAGFQNQALLASDLHSGVLTINSQSTLNGKVELLNVLKKKKSAEMNCIIAINLAERIVADLRCR